MGRSEQDKRPRVRQMRSITSRVRVCAPRTEPAAPKREYHDCRSHIQSPWKMPSPSYQWPASACLLHVIKHIKLKTILLRDRGQSRGHRGKLAANEGSQSTWE